MLAGIFVLRGNHTADRKGGVMAYKKIKSLVLAFLYISFVVPRCFSQQRRYARKPITSLHYNARRKLWGKRLGQIQRINRAHKHRSQRKRTSRKIRRYGIYRGKSAKPRRRYSPKTQRPIRQTKKLHLRRPRTPRIIRRVYPGYSRSSRIYWREYLKQKLRKEAKKNKPSLHKTRRKTNG